MYLSATKGFWDHGVTCFCHEAIGRALHDKFPGVEIGPTDLAHQKYESVAGFNEKLARSAWFEFLYSGPRHRFTLPSGATGCLSRYSIEIDVPESASDDNIAAVREFLESPKGRAIQVKLDE